jgi:hypothetical protein
VTGRPGIQRLQILQAIEGIDGALVDRRHQRA